MRPAFLRRLRVMASMLTEITRIRPMTTYVDPDDTDSRSMPLRVVAMTRAPRGCQPDAPHPAEQADAADHRSSNGLESQVATPDAMVTERAVKDPSTGEEYVALDVHRGASVLPVKSLKAAPSIPWKTLAKAAADTEVIEVLHMVPYYFRSNRGGKGMARTGIRRWIR